MSFADKFINRVAPTLSNVIEYIRAGTARLSPRDDWVEGLRKRLALLGNPFLAPIGRPLIFECHTDDYITTANANCDNIEKALMPYYQRNLTSTRKFRMDQKDRDWANGSFVVDPDDTVWQHHVYLFENGNGTTDLYGHKETSAEKDPYGHVTDDQKHGDPDGLSRGKLDEKGIKYA